MSWHAKTEKREAERDEELRIRKRCEEVKEEKRNGRKTVDG